MYGECMIYGKKSLLGLLHKFFNKFKKKKYQPMGMTLTLEKELEEQGFLDG
jgi:folate-dependent tRNA-U54 methylase TrmFO/GidA